MKSLTLVFILFSGLSFAWEEEPTFQFFPKGRIFPYFLADRAENRTSVEMLFDSRLQARLGTDLGIMGWPGIVRLGIDGGVFLQLRQASGAFPLDTLDGNFAVYLEGLIAPVSVQLRYVHNSAHFGDGLWGIAIPIVYSRETVSLKFSFPLFQLFRIYGAGSYVVNSYPATLGLGLQGGILFKAPWRRMAFLLGTDVKWKQESLFNPAFSIVSGFELYDWGMGSVLDLLYSYYSGPQIQGQYYLEATSFHSVGLHWIF